MVKKEIFGSALESRNFGDLHTHSSFSNHPFESDGTIAPEKLVEIAVEKEHPFLGIVDHDNIGGSAVARNYAEKQGYPIEVIIGAEVSSRDGHILAYKIQDNIPFWKSAEETVRLIHEQGGFAVAAHPFYTKTSHVGEKILKDIAEHEDPLIYWDGIEVFNAGANDFRRFEWLRWLTDGNRRARKFFYKEGQVGRYGVPTGGSDTHKDGVGRTVTVIPEGKTIYQAFEEKVAGIIITPEKEHYSLGDLWNIHKKSNQLGVLRRSMPETARVFPLFEASTVTS